jgi:hypothetical protein
LESTVQLARSGVAAESILGRVCDVLLLVLLLLVLLLVLLLLLFL